VAIRVAGERQVHSVLEERLSKTMTKAFIEGRVLTREH
jgi:hypothetical protein